ncbi:hypothetical protein GCM10027514_14450 [Azotobacter armeniacus]
MLLLSQEMRFQTDGQAVAGGRRRRARARRKAVWSGRARRGATGANGVRDITVVSIVVVVG